MAIKVNAQTGKYVILLLAVMVVGGMYLYRLFTLQVLNAQEFVLSADGQYVRSESLYDRGTIFFTTKDNEKLPAATIEPGYGIAVNPNRVEDWEEVAEVLHKLLPAEYHEEVVERLEIASHKEDDPYEQVVSHLSLEVGNKVKEAKTTGVIVYPERWRIYPFGKIASQTLGFVGWNDEGYGGLYGIERQFDDELSRDKNKLFTNYFIELFGSFKETFVEGDSGDVVTTLEPIVQAELERILVATQEEWGSGYTGGIIMNSQTGDIVAMGYTPDFDPNNYAQADISRFSNPLIESVEEMGSIIKPLTVAAGIDSGVITEDSHYEDRGSIVISGKKISNYDGKARGWVPMQEVLSQSLNTGVAHIVSEMGIDAFREYLLKLGLKEKTLVQLPNEVNNLTDNIDSNRPIEFATASYGQGIALTPMATIRALSSLANHGEMVTPRIIKSLEVTGNDKEFTKPSARVFSTDTAEIVSRMLVNVVDDALAGGGYSKASHSVAAKTGTAQIPKPGGGYYDDRFLHSFFGYFPAYDPQFIVLLYTNHPKGARYASETLTMPFMNLAEYLINYYQIPPDR